MEYLMTYGWSILLIAVVLAALFELGIFSGGGNALPNGCVAQSGFLCTNPQVNTTGNVLVTLGNGLGASIQITGTACMNSSVAPQTWNSESKTLVSGQEASLVFQCPIKQQNVIGASLTGTLWIQYNTGSSIGIVSKVGTVTGKATTTNAVGSTGGGGSSNMYAYVASQGSSNNVVMINTATNTVVSAITSGFSSPKGAAFSPSGTYAYVTNCNSGCGGSISSNVVIINTATNTVVNAITSGFNGPSGVAFSPSGTYAYVVNVGANNVVIINTATNTVVKTITSGFDSPTGVAFLPN